MTQRNEKTGEVRKIRRRDLKTIDEEDVEEHLELQNIRLKLPLNTLAHTASLETERREFSRSEADFDTLVRIFEESMTSHRKSYGSDEWCPKPMVEVTKINEVVSPFKQRFYETARDELGSRNPLGCGLVPGISAPKCDHPVGHVDLNEYFLFHGTKYDQVDQIIDYGFSVVVMIQLDPCLGMERILQKMPRSLTCTLPVTNVLQYNRQMESVTIQPAYDA